MSDRKDTFVRRLNAAVDDDRQFQRLVEELNGLLAEATPWARLQVELLAMESWYRTPMGVGVSVYYASDGGFSGGVYVDGDQLARDEWGDDPLVVDGGTLEQVADGLIEAMRQYRVDRDRERAERLAEEAES